ncbi:glycosyltransferase family 4 protein [Hymenobacter sp. BT635]|uniref:Glycosyltransferase family 4 protein n=1 Tax=Hymenobacter nitidus TaxID=2880929 RepID=A0ABS8AAV5_9BACT|nr:glycosyltransferase family 4 protein [Hymenobacter nitidus]MCB2377522.1 glycosyltransferase family 4 protein [Hymenobacter nitidus]
MPEPAPSSLPPAPSTTASADNPGLAVLCLSGSLGGLELNSLKFTAWMQARGWNATFFAPPATPLAELTGQWAVPFVPTRPARGLGLLAAAQALQQHLHERQVAVLVVTQNKDLNLASLVKLLMRGQLRLVYQQHMQLGQAKRDWFHTWRFGLLDAWLSPLPGLARQVAEKTRYAPERVHVVPLGLPVEQFAGAALTPAEARRALSLPPTGPLLGILGRLDPGKGQDFVVRVLHELRTAAALPVQLVIMGELTRNEGDAYLRHLRELIGQLGLESHVFFREFQPDPVVFYRAIDVFVLASPNETYGMVTLEAMAAGVPVVALAAGGTLELVQEGETGLLYPAGDVPACARQIGHCLAQPALTRQRVARARAYVQGFSQQQQCLLTEEVFRSIGVRGPAPE